MSSTALYCYAVSSFARASNQNFTLGRTAVTLRVVDKYQILSVNEDVPYIPGHYATSRQKPVLNNTPLMAGAERR